jgi:tetratricopeptide (TPR) repeat protein
MENDDLLAQYLDGELEGDEKEAFEKQLANDPTLAERVHLHRRMDEAFGNTEEMKVEAALRGIMDRDVRSDEQEAPARKSNFQPRYLAIAATVILLAVVGFFVLRPKNTVSPQQLYAENYQPYDASGEVRSSQNLPPALLDDAFASYDAKNYPEAMDAFGKILTIVPDNWQAHFFLGICQLETGDPASAKRTFQAVLDNGKNLYVMQSSWYQALASLQMEEVVDARAQFGVLAKQPGAYQKKAQKILDQLGD